MANLSLRHVNKVYPGINCTCLMWRLKRRYKRIDIYDKIKADGKPFAFVL